MIKTAPVQLSYAQGGYPTVRGFGFDLRTGLLKDPIPDFPALLKDIQKIYDLTGQDRARALRRVGRSFARRARPRPLPRQVRRRRPGPAPSEGERQGPTARPLSRAAVPKTDVKGAGEILRQKQWF